MANPPGRTYLRQWHFLGGELVITPLGSVQLTLPAGTTVVSIDAEDAEAYYAINRTGANTNSHGYVPAEGSRVIGPVANLQSVHVYGAAGAVLHITYYREA